MLALLSPLVSLSPSLCLCVLARFSVDLDPVGGLALYLTSKASAFLTGQTISLDGGQTGMSLPTPPDWRPASKSSRL